MNLSSHSCSHSLSRGDHPVVSTVLWMLGHDMKKQRNPMPQQNNSSSNVLSWKDDHGYVQMTFSLPPSIIITLTHDTFFTLYVQYNHVL